MAEITILQGFSYWFWLGTLALFFLTYQDFSNNMKVDDRRNWFMMGATVALLSHNRPEILYIIAAIVLGVGLNILINKLKILGEGDANTLTWLWIGYAFTGFYNLASFLFIFICLYSFYMLVKIIIMRTQKIKTWNTPFYIVIFLSFIITNSIMGLY